jgi:hypothetical protein
MHSKARAHADTSCAVEQFGLAMTFPLQKTIV